MRKFLSLAAAALALASLPALAETKTETLQIKGWHCGGCAARTESALQDVKGVSKVSSDKAKKEVTVTYDDTVAKRADIDKAITDSGFEVVK
jgi:periplasmic mercuric ion binding protein